MAIPYTPNIPQATDQISQSQPKILENFGSINTLIGIDHATFASGNAGMHNKVTMPDQGGAAVFAGTNAGMYATLLAGVNEIYLHKSTFSADVPITAGTMTTAANGWCYLPCGLLMCWGTGVTVSPVVGVTYTAVVAGFPGFLAAPANIPLVMLTVKMDPQIAGNSRSIQLVNAGQTQFFPAGVNTTTGLQVAGVTYQFLAIGRSSVF
jgi:hypothetical protein